MINDLVLNDLYAGTMGSSRRARATLLRAEVFLDSVKVLRVVTVKSCAGLSSFNSI